jgi:hypothetical protein
MKIIIEVSLEELAVIGTALELPVPWDRMLTLLGGPPVKPANQDLLGDRQPDDSLLIKLCQGEVHVPGEDGRCQCRFFRLRN